MICGVIDLLDVEWEHGDHDIDGESGCDIGESVEIKGGFFEPVVPSEVGLSFSNHWVPVGYLIQLLSLLGALLGELGLPEVEHEEEGCDAPDGD